MNDQEILDYIERNTKDIIERFQATNDFFDILEDFKKYTWHEYVIEVLKVYFMDIYLMEADIAVTSAKQFVEKHKDYLKDLYDFERI